MTTRHAHPSTPLARARARILDELAFWNGGTVPTARELRQVVLWSAIATVVAWAVLVVAFGLTSAIGRAL